MKIYNEKEEQKIIGIIKKLSKDFDDVIDYEFLESCCDVLAKDGIKTLNDRTWKKDNLMHFLRARNRQYPKMRLAVRNRKMRTHKRNKANSIYVPIEAKEKTFSQIILGRKDLSAELKVKFLMQLEGVE